MPIYVTKSFLPPAHEYEKILNDIFARGVLTNQGPCVQEFEKKITEYLNVDNFQFLGNGTIALQLALSALDIHGGDIITTPFSPVTSFLST